MYKSIRFFSFVCLLALGSNLVGNFVWTCLDRKVSINMSSEEDETERDSDSGKKNNSSKRGLNMMEEELHLAENTLFSPLKTDFTLIEKTSFSIISDKTNGSEKVPLEIPPEIVNELS